MLKMNKYFKDRMDEIALREEQMAERKTHESEIESLEDRLKSLENNYQSLSTTCESNLEQLALKQVDLTVEKEAYAFAKAMLDEKQASLAEEKRKLDDLHWQVWEEQIRACNDMGKCLEENDSVSFLNEYPRVLKSHQKCAYLTMEESDLVAEQPEIKQLTAEVTALETEIKKAEDSCLSEELQKLLTEIKELGTNADVKIDETQILIEALEASHRERMALEAEIMELENHKIDVPRGEMRPKIIPKESTNFLPVKNEPEYYTAAADALNNEKNFENKLETFDEDSKMQVSNNERDKKLEAKKWYEEYARQIATTTEENIFKTIHAPVESQLDSRNKNRDFSPERGALLSEENEDRFESSEVVEFGIPKGKVKPKRGARSQNLNVKSHFFDNKTKYPLKPTRNLKLEKEDVDVGTVSQGTPSEAYRKFEPLIATPTTFLKSAAEAELDNYSRQSNHGAGSSASVHGIMRVEKSVKFTPKRPSNIGKRSAYRQTKLDDFDNFMLPDNNYTM